MGRLTINAAPGGIDLMQAHNQLLQLDIGFTLYDDFIARQAGVFTQDADRIVMHSSEILQRDDAELGDLAEVTITHIDMIGYTGDVAAVLHPDDLTLPAMFEDTGTGFAWVLQDTTNLFDEFRNDSLRFFGNMGDDRIAAHQMSPSSGVRMMGRAGDDRLEATRFDDVLAGHRGDDWLIGYNGDDVMRGGIGHDVLYAGAGDDFLNGQNGRDTLVGGPGSDILWGGRKADRFVFNDDQTGDDVIKDFQPVYDLCVLHNFDGRLDITDSADGAVLHLSEGSVTFEGLSAADLTEDHFLIWS